MSSRNEVAERNEAAERLLDALDEDVAEYVDGPETAERALEIRDKSLNRIDAALAAERRATVKRIFEAAHRNSHFDGGAFAALRVILDEVANAQEELRTADAKAAR